MLASQKIAKARLRSMRNSGVYTQKEFEERCDILKITPARAPIFRRMICKRR